MSFGPSRITEGSRVRLVTGKRPSSTIKGVGRKVVREKGVSPGEARTMLLCIPKWRFKKAAQEEQGANAKRTPAEREIFWAAR